MTIKLESMVICAVFILIAGVISGCDSSNIENSLEKKISLPRLEQKECDIIQIALCNYIIQYAPPKGWMNPHPPYINDAEIDRLKPTFSALKNVSLEFKVDKVTSTLNGHSYEVDPDESTLEIAIKNTDIQYRIKVCEGTFMLSDGDYRVLEGTKILFNEESYTRIGNNWIVSSQWEQIKAKLPMPTETTIDDYSVGQIWKYKTAPTDTDSRVVIEKISKCEDSGIVLHINIEHLKIELPDGGLRFAISHIPISKDFFASSVTELDGQDSISSKSEEWYDAWVHSYALGNGVIHNKSVANILDMYRQ